MDIIIIGVVQTHHSAKMPVNVEREALFITIRLSLKSTSLEGRNLSSLAGNYFRIHCSVSPLRAQGHEYINDSTPLMLQGQISLFHIPLVYDFVRREPSICSNKKCGAESRGLSPLNHTSVRWPNAQLENVCIVTLTVKHIDVIGGIETTCS